MTNKFDVKALRDKVLNSDDIKYDEVHISEWDVDLPVKTLSSSEMKKVMKYQDDNIRMMIFAVLYGCKTQAGESVFDEKDLAKFEADKAFGPIAKVAGKVMELSGFDAESVADAKNN